MDLLCVECVDGCYDSMSHWRVGDNADDMEQVMPPAGPEAVDYFRATALDGYLILLARKDSSLIRVGIVAEVLVSGTALCTMHYRLRPPPTVTP
jgi:hypothetical protein